MENFYDIALEINVEKQFINSIINLKYFCDLERKKELIFYIHKDIEIEEITCNVIIKYEIINEVLKDFPFILEGKIIKIILEDFIYRNQILDIYFKYNGKLSIIKESGVNRLTKEWIELGLYTPWFPLDKNIRLAKFKAEIEIEEGYNIINAIKKDNKFIINQNIPSFDCTILSSNSFNELKVDIDEINLSVYYTDNKHKCLAEKISAFSKIILKFYKNFGAVENKEFSIVIAPRKEGGGYCRPSLIVLTPDENMVEEEYFKFLAHELAHLWWNKANAITWEDWLNESFAEFSALMAIREVFGKEKFLGKINLYKEKTKALSSIKNLNRGDENAYSILYLKGPLILSKLEKIIGKEKFLELFNKIHINNISNTEKFLNQLEELTNLEIRDIFSKWLSE